MKNWLDENVIHILAVVVLFGGLVLYGSSTGTTRLKCQPQSFWNIECKHSMVKGDK